MSRLTDLMRQLRAADPQLGADLEKEISALTKRRSFGLVFERHQPEAVELPGQKVRRGSKVRILPPRGETQKGDQRLWVVGSTAQNEGRQVAQLVELTRGEAETATAEVSDLVVVAEFDDKIYPGLLETGRVENGGDKPFHTVINAENFHALEMLTYTHRGKIDAIYIDPPYNTGARDWKYNNDYVEGDDDYRHSKWLAFMERRLLIARELLNPDESVLIVTIDEKEYLRLGMLLEQTFPEARTQMVSIVINPLGQERVQQLARVEEYAFFVFLGSASPAPLPDDLLNRSGKQMATLTDDGVASVEETSPNEKVRWEWLLRGGADASRQKSPNLFYPVFVVPEGRIVHSIGVPITPEVDRNSVKAPHGTVAVWPLRTNGEEGRWRCSADYFRTLLAQGYARVGEYDRANDRWSLLYLGKAQIKRIEAGEIEILGRSDDGALRLGKALAREQKFSVKTVWNRPSHRAGEYGTSLNRALIPGRRFPFPKSLYAVEDAIRVAVADKPEAVILDFFSGSGTTAHAVMRLNHQDGGRRQCISVTNNEVGADEQVTLRMQGMRQGDPDWEQWGICDYITKPRIKAAITGNTPEGDPIKGDYKFTDEFPMSEGFEENAAFFTLTYESPLSVRHNRAFSRVAPMLWMRAGSSGHVINDLGDRGWDIADVYAVLEDVDNLDDFLNAMRGADTVKTVFVITDNAAAFQMACRGLPSELRLVQLYESYLQNFEINQGRGF